MAKNNKQEIKNEKREIYNPALLPKNIAGDRRIDELAKKTVLDTLQTYAKMRDITQGGISYRITELWDELYRVYMAIRNDDDHNYQGEAKIFMPVARRAVNVIESEGSNAFFSREDYFSTVPEGDYDANSDMSKQAFQVQLYYSKREDYVSEYELALKQLLIYGCTCVESVFRVDTYTGIERVNDEIEEVDKITGMPLIGMITGKKKTKKEIKTYKFERNISKPRVEARDIYRMFINILATDPSTEDVIYKDEMSSNKLLQMAEDGVYNASAVNKMLLNMPTYYKDNAIENEYSGKGDGKTYVSEMRLGHKEREQYEVLRFQGLFTTKDEETGVVKRKQYWIDLGEREHVLRVQESPIIGADKTFSFCNIDPMIGEFCTDGVIAPIKGINYEINDKENQSLDGLTYALNSPWEILRNSGITDSDIEEAMYTPHKPFFVKEPNSIRKVPVNIELSHVNTEIMRLNNTADNVAGSTSIASGAPTGTQVDRSGKAIGMLQSQTRSQFSKMVRRFERNIIEKSLQKTFNQIMQFSDEDIVTELFDGKTNERSIFKQKVHEIVGRYNIRVSAGSQYLKEREMRDAILEFMSIAGTNDAFIGMVDPEQVLLDVARTSPKNMEKYVNPENAYNSLKQKIEQLNQMVEQQNGELEKYSKEINRLGGELQQTQRANMANPPANAERRQ